MTSECQADNPDATEVAIDNFVVFFIAGQETTANMLSFVLLEMGRNPDVMLRLESSTLPTTPPPPHPLVPHICVGELGQHWVRYWPGGEQAQCHYLKQCWFIINQTLGNKRRWNSNKNKKYFHSWKCIWIYRLWNGGHIVNDVVVSQHVSAATSPGHSTPIMKENMLLISVYELYSGV